jgi:hypothetical protein
MAQGCPSARAPPTSWHASGSAFSSKPLQLTSFSAAAQPATPSAVATVSGSLKLSTQLCVVRVTQASMLP